MQNILEATSGDQTVSEMLPLIECTRSNGLTTAAKEMINQAKKQESILATSIPYPSQSAACIILGAGPTGLSAAYHLDENTLVLEKNDKVGGWCRSIEDAGFTFDYAGHIMFSKDQYVHQMYEKLLGSNVHWQDYEAWIFSKKIFIPDILFKVRFMVFRLKL